MSNLKASSPLEFTVAVAVALGLGSIATTTHADGGFVVVCNSSNPISSLSSADLKKALTGGTKQWGNGAIVQLGIASSETPDLNFLAGAAGMSAAELLSRVQQQVFKGEMRKPVILRSTAGCLGLVRSNPGGICATTAGGALPAEAKIVAIR
jgi:ABC-type phosphate transport system substrate-binding protein